MQKTLTLAIGLLLFWAAAAQPATFFHRAENYGHLSGVVYVERAGTIIHEECYGQAATGRAPQLRTPFDIGSLSKQFTAAAILQLVHREQLQLTDPINQHLGELATKRWKRVTIHQLLTHTSGIPSLYQTEQGLPIFLPEEQPIALRELVNRFRTAKLRFRPGEEFSYSNSGYILLAAIIEQVSGVPYAQFMETEIFSRYGLQGTRVGATDQAAQPYYGFGTQPLVSAPIYDPSWFPGAGGIYSTVLDLNRWMSLIQSDTFLTAELREQFLAPHTRAGAGQYGYGWQINADGAREHDGATAGKVPPCPETSKTFSRTALGFS
ncbi:MAG: serine hydrolase domain-containing protein [Bacteroidota bacterium]